MTPSLPVSPATPLADLVLATYNGRFTHTSLGLRWLLANLGPNPPQTAWHEFDLRVPVTQAVQRIQAHQPRLLALGVYIWNVQPLTALIRELRAANPALRIVLGGPEVSAAPERFPAIDQVDLVITGEAEAIFGSWCRRLLQGERPPQKIVHAPLPDLPRLQLPYHLYSDHDLHSRHIYVETTRGCPFQCDFCVSGGTGGVRDFPLQPTLDACQSLAARGVRTLRFVDRTFNARPGRGAQILNALRLWAGHGLRLHLEFTPQAKYRADLATALCAWPPGSLHIELGIQSFNETVSERVRRPGVKSIDAALNFLLNTVRAEVHADLIVGLPGESWDSIANGFDRLWAHQPHEIQVGVLKHLPGTNLQRHAAAHRLVFDPKPPYALLASDHLSTTDLARLNRFAAYWDRLGNRRLFPRTLPFIMCSHASAFTAFMHLSDWLHAGFGRAHGIDLNDMITALYAYLTYELRYPRAMIRDALRADFCAEGRRPERALPRCLR